MVTKEAIEISKFCADNDIDILKEALKIKRRASTLPAAIRKMILNNYKLIIREAYFLRTNPNVKVSKRRRIMGVNNLVAYQAVRDLMKTGDLIEFGSDKLVGRIIRLFTRKKVNHTSMICLLQNYKTITEPHIYIYEANAIDGTELNLLSKVLEKYKGSARWLRLKATDAQREKLSDWLLEHTGIPYDFKSLFKNALGRVSAEISKLFCSEAAFLALRDGARMVTGDKAPIPGTFTELLDCDSNALYSETGNLL